MDNLPDSQPYATPPQEPKKSLLPTLEWGVGGILLGLVVLLLVVFALNYFGILSLSQLYPNQLGWLPQKASLSQQLLLPIPADDKSIEKIRVLYLFDGRIEKISTDSSNQNKKVLALISGRGYRLPQTLSINSNFPVSPLDENGNFLEPVTAEILEKNDAVAIDFFYDPLTKEMSVGLIRLKPKLLRQVKDYKV